MGGGGGGGEGEFGLQIAPMLDVMFVLMLFFMVMAGSQKTEGELGIDLPSQGVSQNQDKPSSPIYVKIEVNKQVYFNDAPVDTPSSAELAGLKDRLTKAIKLYGEKTPVILVPASQAKHSRIVDVLNACSAAGVVNLSFGASS